MLIVDFPLAALLDIVLGTVFVLFVLVALVLSVVILLQEGKGGGLGSAFGGAAADAFGVKAGTVNKFTAYLAAAFLGLALLYAGLSAGGDRVSIGPEPTPTIAPAGLEATPEGPGVTIPGEEGDVPPPPPAEPAPAVPAPGEEAPGDGAPSDG